MPKPEALKFNCITRYAAEFEAVGKRNALAVFIDVDGAEDGVEIGFAIVVFIVEGTVVDALNQTPLSFHLADTDPPIPIRIRNPQRLQPHLPADHLDEAGTIHMRRIPPFPTILGDRRPGPAIAIW